MEMWHAQPWFPQNSVKMKVGECKNYKPSRVKKMGRRQQQIGGNCKFLEVGK
jgi:hypothetical protein